PDATNNFRLEFFDSGYTSRGHIDVPPTVTGTPTTIGIFSTSYLEYAFTPTYTAWKAVVDGLPAGQRLTDVHWVVEAQDTNLHDLAPVPAGILPTPGRVAALGPNQLDRFWSAGATVSGENTPSGQPAPDAVKQVINLTDAIAQ